MKKFIVLVALFAVALAAPQIVDGEIKTEVEPQILDEEAQVVDEKPEILVEESQVFDETPESNDGNASSSEETGQVMNEEPEKSEDEEVQIMNEEPKESEEEEVQVMNEEPKESEEEQIEEDTPVESERAQMFFNPMMMGGMFPQSQQQEYPIDYSMSCSNSCNCGSICIPWWPCPCKCPPPCPPATEAPTTVAPLCENGAPDFTFPWCCVNGATNLFCCLNGANNPECEPATVPPPDVEGTTTTAPCNGGGCCKPCIPCMPCMVWWMCRPCGCNNGCDTTTTAPPIVEPPTQPPPLCVNGAPDFTFPWCCLNGATNQFCCLNGADNPECEPATIPPIVEPTPAPPCNGGGCCQPCMPCMPCMIWWMCPPCNCNNGCQTTTTTSTTTVAPPLCVNGAPDFTFPWCCINGATNQFCCLNGADNVECILDTPPPPPVEPTPPANGCPCTPICRPCMPWFPCQPCTCPCSGSGHNSNRHFDHEAIPYERNDMVNENQPDQWQQSWNNNF